ncbi:AMP-binding protein [Saccharomonospora sp. NPDC046836]|uniref:AMP-binding protein n=1 Tax=Saccharomonospora sp. NPDC046836 TaxID=3156921 RepID=UPI0033F50E9A
MSPTVDLIEAERGRHNALLLRSEGVRVSVGEFADLTRRAALLLEQRGVRRGQRVALIEGNTLERLIWQYAVWWLGAIEISVNNELKGAMLDHVLSDSEPELVISGEAIDLPTMDVVTIGMSTRDLPMFTEEDHGRLVELQVDIPPETHATILYTSGTTGPSKGVVLPRGYFSNLGAVWASIVDVGQGDVVYFSQPFFHVDAHLLLPMCMQTGAVMAYRRRFSVSCFWADVSRFDATIGIAVGAMLSALTTTTPPAPDDVSLRCIICAPVPEEAYRYFEDQLGVPLLAMYGQTEANGVTFETPGNRRRGSAGKALSTYDVEIQDEHGQPMPPGAVGEIVYRPLSANIISAGYWKRDDATREAWRGLWFHTGDLGLLDADGFLFYKGRLTDSLRRRGENISSWELETIVRTLPGVDACAAIGIPDPLGGEDRIKIFVATQDPGAFDPRRFFEACHRALPRFAVPDLVEVVTESEFVRGAGTAAIQKHLLSRAVEGPSIHAHQTRGDRSPQDRSTR